MEIIITLSALLSSTIITFALMFLGVFSVVNVAYAVGVVASSMCCCANPCTTPLLPIIFSCAALGFNCFSVPISMSFILSSLCCPVFAPLSIVSGFGLSAVTCIYTCVSGCYLDICCMGMAIPCPCVSFSSATAFLIPFLTCSLGSGLTISGIAISQLWFQFCVYPCSWMTAEYTGGCVFLAGFCAYSQGTCTTTGGMLQAPLAGGSAMFSSCGGESANLITQLTMCPVEILNTGVGTFTMFLTSCWNPIAGCINTLIGIPALAMGGISTAGTCINSAMTGLQILVPDFF